VILVIAEHNNHSLHDGTLKIITAALQLKSDQNLKVLVAGYQCDEVVQSLQQIKGVDEVLVADDVSFENSVAESLTALILSCANEATHILAPASTFGKNFLPRVAALLDVEQVSDVVEIIDANTYKRPVYAGNAIATIQSSDKIQVLTIRTTAFDAAQITDQQAKVTEIKFNKINEKSKFIKHELHKSERPELSSAKLIISLGRGVKDQASFDEWVKVADQMGAAVGASRAVVDAGMAPNDFQVGQTGHIVAPEIYIALGISGAIQHLAGMKDSRMIIAVNKDPDAAIFEVADYGLVADLEKLLPAWQQWLQTKGE